MTDLSNISPKEAQKRVDLIDRELWLATMKRKGLELLQSTRLRNRLLKKLSLSNMLKTTVSTHISLQALNIYYYEMSERGEAVTNFRIDQAKRKRRDQIIAAINAGTMKIDTPKMLRGKLPILLPDNHDVNRFG